MGRFFAIALLLAAPAENRPSLVLRVAPRMVIADLGAGCAPVLFTAEIRGPEVESWYCPRVEWTWPDSTTSATESDCPPFEARNRCVEPQKGCGWRGWHRLPNGTIVDNIKECPCTIVGYPRRWTRNVCMPSGPEDGWMIQVRLTRGRTTLATQRVSVWVK